MSLCVGVGVTDVVFFFFSSRRRHTRLQGDWSSDVCSSDLDTRGTGKVLVMEGRVLDHAGQPVAHAIMDAWHANKSGGYSHLFPGLQKVGLRRQNENHAPGQYPFRPPLPPGHSVPPPTPTPPPFG